jgi:ElaB/YqjD/DUF883 family membrane-anchored ribosome-binding protein
MAKQKKNSSEFLSEEKQAVETAYNKIIDQLKIEKERAERELKHEYRNARRYVRANPEIGVGLAFVGGLLTGIILAKLTR